MDDPVLVRLASLSDHLLRLPVPDALNLVLQATGLHEWAIALPEGAQARADLLRLEAEAEAFAMAHRDLKAASGFHGDTAKVFLGWLDARTAERDFDRRPDPSVDVAEAVEIVTWHASKGREWPITVVAEFDYDIEERPGTTATHFEALDQIEAGGFRGQDQLGQAVMVAQVDEDQPAMVALAMDPAGEADCGAGIGRAKRAAGV
jgi:superfamily I DNA/RNA helicase